MKSDRGWDLDALNGLEIVIAENAAPPEEFAATELRRCLEKMTGLRPAIVRAATPGVERRIVLGEAATTISPQTLAKIRHDGFVTAFDGETLSVRGSRPRGTLNGVYDLLRGWGFRWMFPRQTEEIVPTLKTLPLRKGVNVSNPDLELRGVCVFPVRPENEENLRAIIDWMGKNRFNLLMTSVKRTEKRPGGWKVEWQAVSDALLPETRKRGILLNISEHSGRYFFPTSYFDEHPEWFAMNADGQRFAGGQICYSNENAVAVLAENMARYAEEHPEVDILGTWPEDGYGFCQCDACRQPGAVLKAIDRIAGKIEKVRPDLTVEYLSYTKETSDVPSDILPRSNMAILVANPRVAREWLSKSDQVGGRGVYRLHYQIADNTAMRANLPLRFEKTRQDCADAKAMGLRGVIPFFIGIDTWWRSSLNLCFLSEFCWDTNKTVEETLDDFCRSYYGAAAAKTRETLQALEAMPPVSLDAPPPWPLWQDWPTLGTAFTGEKGDAIVAYFEKTRASLAAARREGEETGIPSRRFDAIEAFLDFNATMFAGWRERSLAVLAFERQDATEVRAHIVAVAKQERRLIDLLNHSLNIDDGVNGARPDFDFFQNWRLQQDKQLLEGRTNENRGPFIDNNPDVEMFLPGLLGL